MNSLHIKGRRYDVLTKYVPMSTTVQRYPTPVHQDREKPRTFVVFGKMNPLNYIRKVAIVGVSGYYRTLQLGTS